MLLIVDANNLAHRCRHVFNLSNAGVDVSVTYGFLKVMQSLISKHKPTSIMICVDGGTPEFRRQSVPEYKANRHKDEDPEVWADFNRQLDELADYVLPMMGMVVVRKRGAEADDLMYHASRLYKGYSVIVTNDKDLLQAVNSQVSVLNPGKEVVYNMANFKELVGVSVYDYIDWRAIQGDSSDNIPGIIGVGEKTATKLFETYKSLTGIVNAALGLNPAGKIEGKIAERIATFGWERISKNVSIMALYADRVGAKQAILEAVEAFMPADKVRMKKYFMRSGFVSLMDGKFYNEVLALRKPTLRIEGTRFPIIATRRKPLL